MNSSPQEFFAIIVVFVVVICVIGFISSTVKKEKRDLAQSKFMESLSALRNDPTNGDLRINALQSGREYSKLTRVGDAQHCRYEYDEAALSNDIGAAMAAGSTRPQIQDRQVDELPSKSREERLAELHDLWSKGLM